MVMILSWVTSTHSTPRAKTRRCVMSVTTASVHMASSCHLHSPLHTTVPTSAASGARASMATAHASPDIHPSIALWIWRSLQICCGYVGMYSVISYTTQGQFVFNSQVLLIDISADSDHIIWSVVYTECEGKSASVSYSVLPLCILHVLFVDI
jgi:hypothetical protein